MGRCLNSLLSLTAPNPYDSRLQMEWFAFWSVMSENWRMCHFFFKRQGDSFSTSPQSFPSCLIEDPEGKKYSLFRQVLDNLLMIDHLPKCSSLRRGPLLFVGSFFLLWTSISQTSLYITKFLSITNDFLRPSNSKKYGKEPRYKGTSLYLTIFDSDLKLALLSRFHSCSFTFSF